MASWFGPLLALVAPANGIGLALLAGSLRPPSGLAGRPSPSPVADGHLLMPFALGLFFVVVAWALWRWGGRLWLRAAGATLALSIATILVVSGFAGGPWFRAMPTAPSSSSRSTTCIASRASTGWAASPACGRFAPRSSGSTPVGSSSFTAGT